MPSQHSSDVKLEIGHALFADIVGYLKLLIHLQSERRLQNERKVQMEPTPNSVNERRAWNALAAHYQKIRELHLRKLFADDPTRGQRLTVEAAGLFLDHSKNRITDETLKLLVQLADE